MSIARITAHATIHELGHAALVLSLCGIVSSVRIYKGGAGTTYFHLGSARTDQKIAIYMAGVAAEWTAFGDVIWKGFYTSHGVSDFHRIIRTIEARKESLAPYHLLTAMARGFKDAEAYLEGINFPNGTSQFIRPVQEGREYRVIRGGDIETFLTKQRNSV